MEQDVTNLPTNVYGTPYSHWLRNDLKEYRNAVRTTSVPWLITQGGRLDSSEATLVGILSNPLVKSGKAKISFLSPTQKLAIAKDMPAPAWLLLQFITDKASYRFRKEIAKRPDLTGEIIDFLYKTGDPDILTSLTVNPCVDEELKVFLCLSLPPAIVRNLHP